MILLLFIIYYLFYRQHVFSEHIGLLIRTKYKKDIVINHYKIVSTLKKISLLEGYQRSKEKFINQCITSSVYGIVFFITLLFRGLFDLWFYVLSITMFIILLPYLKLREREKIVEEMLFHSLPLIILQVDLLTSAGMSMTYALEDVTKRQDNDFEKVFYQNILKIRAGQAMERVLMNFSEGCQNMYLTRLIRIIISDNRNGTKETRLLLKQLNDDIWLNKKSLILKKGEEASTKLLLPMAISFIGIIIAITVPAIVELFAM